MCVNFWIVFEVGDLLFINNFVVFYVCVGFVDLLDDVWNQWYIMCLWLYDSYKGWEFVFVLQRKLDEMFDLNVVEKVYWIKDEMDKVVFGMRIKQMGIFVNLDYD